MAMLMRLSRPELIVLFLSMESMSIRAGRPESGSALVERIRCKFDLIFV